MFLDQPVQGSEGSFVFRPIRQKSKFWKVNVSPFFRLLNKKGRRTPDRRLKLHRQTAHTSETVPWVRSIQTKFSEIRSKTQWIGSFQPEKFRTNWSTSKGGPLFPVGPVGIFDEWLAPPDSCVRNYIVYSMLPSIRTLKTKNPFLRRPFQLSVNEVFRMKAEHFSFKMKVLAS